MRRTVWKKPLKNDQFQMVLENLYYNKMLKKNIEYYHQKNKNVYNTRNQIKDIDMWFYFYFLYISSCTQNFKRTKIYIALSITNTIQNDFFCTFVNSGDVIIRTDFNGDLLSVLEGERGENYSKPELDYKY